MRLKVSRHCENNEEDRKIGSEAEKEFARLLIEFECPITAAHASIVNELRLTCEIMPDKSPADISFIGSYDLHFIAEVKKKKPAYELKFGFEKERLEKIMRLLDGSKYGGGLYAIEYGGWLMADFAKLFDETLKGTATLKEDQTYYGGKATIKPIWYWPTKSWTHNFTRWLDRPSVNDLIQGQLSLPS